MNKKLFLAAILTVTLSVAVVGAVYWIYSGWKTVTVATYTLTMNPTSQTLNRYQNATFNIELLKDGGPVTGVTVTLYKEITPSTIIAVDTALTDGSGEATLEYNMTEVEGSSLKFKAGYEVP